MMVPFGSPQLSQLYLQASDRYEVDIVQGPDLLVSAFGSGSHDVIFAPTNLGARLIQEGSPYQLAAVVVWGNLYLASIEEEINDLMDLEGKTIHVFGQNQTSDVIIRFVLQQSGITSNLVYIDSVATAQGLLIAGEADIIMTAEPSLSVLMSNYPGLHTIDIQAAYQSLTGSTSYPQAGVFIKDDMGASSIERLLSDLEQSIETTLDDIDATAQLAVDLGMSLAVDVLIQAIPNSHLMYQNAMDSKSAIEGYFQLILDINPNLIGGQLPDDDFYHQ